MSKGNTNLAAVDNRYLEYLLDLSNIKHDLSKDKILEISIKILFKLKIVEKNIIIHTTSSYFVQNSILMSSF